MLREDRYKKNVSAAAERNSLITLLAILAIVFCIFKFVYIVYELVLEKGALYRPEVFNWFALPADLNELVKKPWTVFTYMFMHDRVFHLLGNLLWLWAFGFIFQDLAGSKRMFPVFLYGGLAGALVFILSFNLLPAFTKMLPVATIEGASAGIMAIAIAATTLSPKYRLFPMLAGGIPLWVLTLVFVIIDFASITGSNGGGHLSHLAGALAGFLFSKALQNGYDSSSWFVSFSEWFNSVLNPSGSSAYKKSRQEYYYDTRGKEPYKKIPNVTQNRVDEILDKILQKGYSSLSEEEKDILKRAARNEDL